MRLKLTWKCDTCKMENYHGTKNKTKHPEKLEIKKYCAKCNAHRLHKESKIK